MRRANRVGIAWAKFEAKILNSIRHPRAARDRVPIAETVCGKDADDVARIVAGIAGARARANCSWSI